MNIQTIICIIFLCLITIISRLSKNNRKVNLYVYYLSILFALVNIVFNPFIELNFNPISVRILTVSVMVFIVAFIIGLTFKQNNEYALLIYGKEKIEYFIKYVLIVPVVEELIFRGYLQCCFSYTFNCLVTILIVSLIFIINHNLKNRRLLYLIIYSPILSFFAQYNFLLNLCMHIVVNFACYVRFYTNIGHSKMFDFREIGIFKK